MALHLRMTGQLLLLPRRQPPDKHCHLEILLAGTDRKLVYRDVRKFGRLELLPGSQEDFIRAHRLGPDALYISPERLYESLRRTRRGLKAALLDQRLLAGLGNIYTDEVLFRERLSPLRRSDSLSRRRVQALAGTIKAVLRAALRRRGTSISDYVDPGGRRGGFQFALLVYGREGAACPRCGAAIVRTRVAGRGTWTCPRCQRVPARRRMDSPGLWCYCNQRMSDLEPVEEGQERGDLGPLPQAVLHMLRHFAMLQRRARFEFGEFAGFVKVNLGRFVLNFPQLEGALPTHRAAAHHAPAGTLRAEPLPAGVRRAGDTGHPVPGLLLGDRAQGVQPSWNRSRRSPSRTKRDWA